jgi:drug/metabolite transporter (DMT)-like permease
VTAVRLCGLTVLAMLAFAGNSLLCRLALKATAIDPATFTSIRIVAGAAMLWLLVRVRSGAPPREGSWPGALMLVAYAIAFSFAYVHLGAATGALLLFAAVQATMVGYGWWRGERLRGRRLGGFVLALAGLVGLVLPGLSAPPIAGAALMIAAGVAWGVYSLLGKHGGDPSSVTAGNFVRAVVPALVVSALMASSATLDGRGMLYAGLSGAITSGLGYVIWYAVLPALSVSAAAVAQLSVPIIAAAGGVALLDEPLTLRLVAASVLTLGGIALVVLPQRSR